MEAEQLTLDRLLDLLQSLTDPDECRYDHHGYCQAHGLDPAPCPHQQAREILAQARPGRRAQGA